MTKVEVHKYSLFDVTLTYKEVMHIINGLDEYPFKYGEELRDRFIDLLEPLCPVCKGDI